MKNKKEDDKKIETGKVKELATRAAFGDAIIALGKKDKRIVALTADLSESTKVSGFAEEFPDRFFQIGIAEQNMMNIAAGLSATGKIPFVATFAIFSSGRAWEQMRTAVCYANMNVKIIGSHSGLSNGGDGASHQELEDIAITRVIPNLRVIVPCDYVETVKAVIEASKIEGPVYIRVSRDNSPVITRETTRFQIGDAEVFSIGKDASIIACGKMVAIALDAAEELKKEGVFAGVINLHTIKPIDEKTILNAAKETGAIVTAEEHQVHGGMGSAVLEVLAGHPVPVEMVGVKDRFGQSGKVPELMKEYGLTKEDIKKAVHEVMKRKNQKTDSLRNIYI
ncbi:MAG: transketolase family protein [Candidatus Woesearchaeota archaeon]|nr:transketolase family protein [Candidatus Woesearchaeota archaeon]